MFHQTLLPLGLSATIQLAAAAAYAATFVVFPKDKVGLDEQITW